MQIQNQWHQFLGPVKSEPYFQQMMGQLAQWREEGQMIYPPADQVFEAFRRTDFDQIKVVILGQDPYHGPDQAHGLCFSVQPGIRIPPSLVNIYKELASDIPGFEIPNHGYLADWADQGVLLLNTVLTVNAGQAHSHASLGWETFTDKVIELINAEREGVVFLLWGSHAQKKGRHIDTSKHFVLKAPHPSPLSAHRGFLGCRHFSQTNAILIEQGKSAIDWQPKLPEAG